MMDHLLKEEAEERSKEVEKISKDLTAALIFAPVSESEKTDATQSKSKSSTKKKNRSKKREIRYLSESVEGYVGLIDVDKLEKYVNGTQDKK